MAWWVWKQRQLSPHHCDRLARYNSLPELRAELMLIIGLPSCVGNFQTLLQSSLLLYQCSLDFSTGIQIVVINTLQPFVSMQTFLLFSSFFYHQLCVVTVPKWQVVVCTMRATIDRSNTPSVSPRLGCSCKMMYRRADSAETMTKSRAVRFRETRNVAPWPYRMVWTLKPAREILCNLNEAELQATGDGCSLHFSTGLQVFAFVEASRLRVFMPVR